MQNQKGNIVLMIIGTIAFVVWVGSIGYLAVIKFSKKEEQKQQIHQQPQVQQQDRDNKQQEVKDKIADWKIYINEKNKFEIKYPEDWLIQRREYKEDLINFTSPNRKKLSEENAKKFPGQVFDTQFIEQSFTVAINDSKFSSTAEYKNHLIKTSPVGCFAEKENLIVSGYQAFRYVSCDALPAGDYIEWIANKKLFTVNIYDANDFNDILIIISTFKFIDEVADWKIYRNEEYKFQIMLTNSFNGYKVEKAIDDYYASHRFSFSIPSTGLDQQVYVDVFTILIIPKNIWESIYKDYQSLPSGDVIGENNNFIFIAQTTQDPAGLPSELLKKGTGSEFQQIFSTFKFIK